MIKNKVLIFAMLIVAIVAVGSVSATDDVAIDIDEPADDIAIDEIAIEDDSAEIQETTDCLTNDNLSNDESDCQEFNPFTNPNFEEGEVNSRGNVYGWNTTSKSIRGENPQETVSSAFQIVSVINPPDSPDYNSKILTYNGRALFFENPGGDDDCMLSQYINFDSIDYISFDYLRAVGTVIGSLDFKVYIGDVVVSEVSTKVKGDTWNNANLDVKDFKGTQLFKITIYGSAKKNAYFKNFTVTYNDKVTSYFENIPKLNGEDINVQFTNSATGLINSIFWDFGDGTNSTEINPVHTFKSGDYTVTLTVANENNTDTYSTVLSLKYPTINGQMYSSVQDAIDDAEEGAVIDIPNDLSENLNVNKTVTLNFNGNKLTGSINVNDGAIVTVNNISDVSSVSTDDSSKLTIADSNINSNLELKSGNIDLNSVNFNNCILTITAANTTLVNVNVANGGIVINGGKSKITKSNFTDSTNVITQNDGELELTNNIIKNNNNAINITGGSATISYNAIYNNTGNLTLTGATVTNNWFGTNQVSGYESYLRLVLTLADSEMYPDTEYTIKVEFVPNTGSMDDALNDLTLDITSTNGEITSPIVISDNQGELKFTAGAISDEVKFTLLGEDYTLVNDDNPVSIVAKPLDTNLVINSSAKGVVVIKLTTAEGNVVGAIVSYSINGAEKINATTDDNGEIIIKDLTGKVEINATYAGNKTLNPITGNGAFDFTETTDNKTNTSSDSKPTTTTHTQTATAKTVKVASKIVAKKKTFKVKTKTKKYKITLKTKSGKAIKKVKVTLKVKGKTYKAKTNAKGVATFKITKLNKKGKYTAKIKFAGNKSYKATSKKIKLTVKK